MIRRCAVLVAGSLLLGPGGALPVLADESEAHEEQQHGEYHENLVAVFIGVAAEERRESGLALGLEYERRLNSKFGIGVLAEHTFGDIDANVYALPLAFHTGPWKFYVAPGIEDSELGKENLLRVGGEYGFEVGHWEVSPQIDIDFVDGDSIYVIGVTIGKGF
jgi:hypothetical protein